jgi:hypothetical protein
MMNKRRLLKLADLLEADANNPKGIKFNLKLWGKLVASPEDFPEAIPVNCGTMACAVGLACISGEFKRSGLTYITGNYDGNHFVPSFGEFTGEEAVNRFFGLGEPDEDGDLSSEEFNFLFVAAKYPRRKQSGRVGELAVAKRIRDFVAGKAMPA